MSDSESTMAAGPPHPHLGGKSLQSLERPRYKSWRKKYRKMRHHFDGVLEENKRVFKDEQKLDAIAKRLREELDGLLELCLDLNQNPAIPPELRFDITYPGDRTAALNEIEPDISPDKADGLFVHYNAQVRTANFGNANLHRLREQIDARLAAQDVESLEALEKSVPQPVPSPDDSAGGVTADDTELGSWLGAEQEDQHLARMDAKFGPDHYTLASAADKSREQDVLAKEGKHWAELTPRELERQVELQNPQSQHNWLKIHHKNTNPGDDDAESVASHDTTAKAPKKRPGKDKNLAKQVGDRAVVRAREGWSPSAGSAAMEEDELVLDEGAAGGKKRSRDPDGTYRLKGGKGGSSAVKTKRKRSGEDLGGAGLKKARVEGD
ncbi:uncharacterized protein LTR77_009421 [Saxophila tyrrhenica]|uniref:Uncharacterized protein n=1 Tax=Saxophila tyrrhenica TaxID=1690608 RepID=A0AAV9NXL8_9PEZI|nr:hypothetical protein LTR77_009421 [Saxophila tyrrhenica]